MTQQEDEEDTTVQEEDTDSIFEMPDIPEQAIVNASSPKKKRRETLAVSVTA